MGLWLTRWLSAVVPVCHQSAASSEGKLMSKFLVVTDPNSGSAERVASQKVGRAGGHITQRYGAHVLIVDADDPDAVEELAETPEIAGVYAGPVPSSVCGALDSVGRLGVAAWNERHSSAFAEAKKDRVGDGVSWGHRGFEREG
jgi:hypothetical protein